MLGKPGASLADSWPLHVVCLHEDGFQRVRARVGGTRWTWVRRRRHSGCSAGSPPQSQDYGLGATPARDRSASAPRAEATSPAAPPCRLCRKQVKLCARCDRGQEFCGRECASISRRQSVREAGQRYQQTLRGGQWMGSRGDETINFRRAHRYCQDPSSMCWPLYVMRPLTRAGSPESLSSTTIPEMAFSKSNCRHCLVARICSGVVPVQAAKAREKELGSS